MIDLNRFTKEVEVVMPIVNGWGQYNGRKLYFPELNGNNTNKSAFRISPENRGTSQFENANSNAERPNSRFHDATAASNGRTLPIWYVIKLGNKPTAIRVATLLQERNARIGKIGYDVYVIGPEGIPFNSDTFKRRGFGESIFVNGLNLPLFSTARVIRWEDGRFYFHERTFSKQRNIILRVKEAFEKEQNLLGVRGVTPELRYYYLLANLQRQSIRAVEEFERLKLSEQERIKRVAEYQSTFPGRLQSAIAAAGGTLARYSKVGESYLVEWTIGSQLVKSTINDEFRIISAGFCLSGHDREHTMNSIVNLAKLYQEDDPLYITRE